MEEQFREYVGSLSNEDLVGYATSPLGEHHPDAVRFAQEVLRGRGLSDQELRTLEEKCAADREQRRQDEVAPLSWSWRITAFACALFFIFPLIVVLVPTWLRFRQNGEKKKNRDMWLFALAGLAASVALVNLDIPPWSYLANWLAKAH